MTHEKQNRHEDNNENTDNKKTNINNKTVSDSTINPIDKIVKPLENPTAELTIKKTKRTVIVNAYDLSKGLAKTLPMLQNKIDAVWHTCVLIGETEYFFQNGIVKSPLHQSYGIPLKTHVIGELHESITEEHVYLILDSLKDKYNSSTYNLFENNCNHFSNEFCLMLTGKGIPQYILDCAEIAKDLDIVKMFFK